MIERYSTPEMNKLWSEENKLTQWLNIEILAVEALVKLGQVTQDDLKKIKKGARFQLQKIGEIEKNIEHDVIAFLTNVAENVGPSGRFLHFGMTSSDVLDTSLAVLMFGAMDILLEDYIELVEVVKAKALEHKHTVMIGRSHGVHAEPTTLGLKLALFLDELYRNMDRLIAAKKTIAYGKISGAVGTYANIDPRVEEYVCEKLKLVPAPVSNQIIQRDRHAQYITAIAITGSSLEKFALEIRHLHRTEVQEVQEPFGENQKGSSAMPHKRNPIICERVCGLARILRGYSAATMENIALWHERDISHSSVERVIIPDATTLLHYMIRQMTRVFKGMVVYPEHMKQNLELTQGAIFSQTVLLELVRKGMAREEAYRVVQKRVLKAVDERHHFKDVLLSDAEFLKLMNPEEIDRCFDLKHHLKNIDLAFKRLGI